MGPGKEGEVPVLPSSVAWAWGLLGCAHSQELRVEGSPAPLRHKGQSEGNTSGQKPLGLGERPGTSCAAASQGMWGLGASAALASTWPPL